jgi:hypothetical protein
VSDVEVLCVATESLPTIYVQYEGVWREPPPLAPSIGAEINALRERLDNVIKAAMDAGSELPADVMGIGSSLYQKLIPDPEIREALRRAADSPEGDKPPVLRVHAQRSYDWIPWELLYDGSDFLGLRFQMARLPIVAKPPDMSDRTRHPLRQVRSILGVDVIPNAADDEFDRWRRTFDGLLPEAAEELRLPPAEFTGEGWPTTDIFKECQRDDILHFTCHGAMKDREVYWTLKRGDPEFWKYEVTSATLPTLNLSYRRPLVFGNACKSGPAEAGLLPGLAIALFELGALNVVATFAPISRDLAIDFARLFYERLLGANGEAGSSVAEALWAVKRRYSESGATDPSYLFYCLYGPPDTRFVADGG